MATKLIVPNKDSEKKDEPKDDSKKKKTLLSFKKKIKGNNYNDYTGVVDESGKHIDNPTVGQAMNTMVKYAKNNKMPGTTTLQGTDISSNVYRPKMAHKAVVYDKKKEEAKPKSKIS